MFEYRESNGKEASGSIDTLEWDYTQVCLPIDLPPHRAYMIALGLAALGLILAVLEMAGT